MTRESSASWVFDYFSNEIDLLPSRQEHSHPAVYALHHEATDKSYVGSTQDLYTRISQHRRHLNLGDHRNPYLQAAFNESPEVSVHYTSTETVEQALLFEQQLLDEHHADDKLFNIGIYVDNPRKGRVLSDEAKQALRESTLQQFATEEARAVQRTKSLELWQDPDYRAKQIGRRASPETLIRLGNVMSDRWNDPAIREKMMARHKKPVVFRGVTYASHTEAAEALGISKATYFRWRSKENPISATN